VEDAYILINIISDYKENLKMIDEDIAMLMDKARAYKVRIQLTKQVLKSVDEDIFYTLYPENFDKD